MQISVRVSDNDEQLVARGQELGRHDLESETGRFTEDRHLVGLFLWPSSVSGFLARINDLGK